MKRPPCILLLSSLALLFSLAGGPCAEAAGPLKVFTSVLPLKYFVERVGGERVAVQVMVGPGRSPHTYEPKPRQMAALAHTRLYYRVGVPFETAWMRRIASLNPEMEIVDLRQGLQLRPLEGHHHEGEGHDEHAVHDQGHGKSEELDPHLWTDPQMVQQMAQRIRATLSAADPAGEAVYRA
ncbi:MAG: zinc ABC transporter substrate-binding protein, partial [Syntrophotaleaceae bacterium]